jgi:CCR4-NOT transcriptional regulation complex NOT5 subunit
VGFGGVGMQETVQQLLAAERLKQQGWTYHTELKKWYKAIDNCTRVNP